MSYLNGFPNSSVVKNLPAMQETLVQSLGWEDPLEKGWVGYPLQYSWAFLVAQQVKNLPATQETWVWSLGWGDPLEKGKATHSSILAWRIPWTVHGVAKSWTWLSDFHFHFNGPVAFPTFFNLSLNFAIRSSWSEPQSASGLVFADCIELLRLRLQRISSIWFQYWPSGNVHV